MRTEFSLVDIDKIKRELLSLLPEVKSSHRVEALARGLGWNTNAALRVDLAKAASPRTVDDHAFTDYLKEHGFSGTMFNALSEAVVRCKFTAERTAIKAVMEHEPTLTKSGFGIFRDERQSREERRREFQKARSALLTPEGVDQFLRARAFLMYFPKRRTINKRVSSYGLKHRAEHFHRDQGRDDNYVSNGAMIAAAIHLNFDFRANGPNAHFNIGRQREQPVPHASALGRCIPAQRQRRRGPRLRETAWRNMMIAGINAGLDQHVFGLESDQNHWNGRHATYRFTFAGLPAIACVTDAGRGELVFHVAVKPTQDAERWINCDNAFFSAGDAFAAGWLERRNGKWLQTSAGPICAFRRDLLPVIAAAAVEARGYTPEGRLM